MIRNVLDVANVCFWHIAALAALQHFGSYWMHSGHVMDLVELTLKLQIEVQRLTRLYGSEIRY